MGIVLDRTSHTLLGCHIVGERAVDIVQMAAVAIAARVCVDELVRVPISFPIYAGVLFRAVYIAAAELEPGRTHCST